MKEKRKYLIIKEDYKLKMAYKSFVFAKIAKNPKKPWLILFVNDKK